jgi:hypothetical protein
MTYGKHGCMFQSLKSKQEPVKACAGSKTSAQPAVVNAQTLAPTVKEDKLQINVEVS